MLGIGFWEWIIIFSILLLLFGRGRVADLAEEFGKSVRAFKKGMQSSDKKETKNKVRRKAINKRKSS